MPSRNNQQSDARQRLEAILASPNDDLKAHVSWFIDRAFLELNSKRVLSVAEKTQASKPKSKATKKTVKRLR